MSDRMMRVIIGMEVISNLLVETKEVRASFDESHFLFGEARQAVS